MARSNESPLHAPPEANVAAESDDVQQSLELLDRVLLEFEDPCRAPEPPPPPEEAARLISAIMSSPRASPGHSLQRRTPPDPGGLVKSPSQTSAATQTTLPKARHAGPKKLSSQFGSLPFDLSSHAAPQPPPPWLVSRGREFSSNGSAAGGARTQLHLPIQNPLTSSLGAAAQSDSSDSDDEHQFSDDSLEGQVSSSDREADLRDLGSTTSREELALGGPPDCSSDVQKRGSIAWDISLDWDLDEAAAASKKRRREEGLKGASHSQPQTPSCPPSTSTSLSGGGTYVIRERRKRPALEDAFLYVPVIPLSSTFTAGVSPLHHQQFPTANMTRGRSLPVIQMPYKPSSTHATPIHVPEPHSIDTKPTASEDVPSSELCDDQPSHLCKEDVLFTEEGVLPLPDSVDVSEQGSVNLIDSSSDITSKCNNIVSNPPEKLHDVPDLLSETKDLPASEEKLSESKKIIDDTGNTYLNKEIDVPSVSAKADYTQGIEIKHAIQSPEISEMSFKIMRPKKIRPTSMPANEPSIVVFKSTVQLEAHRGENKQSRPVSGPPSEVDIAEKLSSKCPPMDPVTSIIPYKIVPADTHASVADTNPGDASNLPIEQTTSECVAEVDIEKIRPQSVIIPSAAQIILPSRSMSYSEVNCINETCNSVIIQQTNPETSASFSPTEIKLSEARDSLFPVHPEHDEKMVAPNHEALSNTGASDVPFASSVVDNSLPLPNDCQELPESVSVEEELPPPPSALELESAEMLSEMADKVEVPVTVNSLVQTDITLGKRHKLSFDSPSEEQVVPSLGFRTNTLLTPDEPIISKHSSVVDILIPALNGTDVFSTILDSDKNVMEPEMKTKSMDNPNSSYESKDFESELVTTVILETKEDVSKEETPGTLSSILPVNRPTELLACRNTALDPKLSRDSHRRKSHGSSLEMTSHDSEKRRSAPESSFLFPQGHYTIPLSFAITNKPPNRSQENTVCNSNSAAIVLASDKSTAQDVESNSEPVYKSVKKKSAINGAAKNHHSGQPPPLPPHQNLTPQEDDYAEPRNIPDFGSNAKKNQSKPPRPSHLSSLKEQLPPPPPPHQTDIFEAEKPLPPTPLTPVQNTKLSIVEDFDCHPLPPSPRSPMPPRPLPMSATFPVPPSPSTLHKNSKSQHLSPSPMGGRRRLTPPSPSLPRAPYPLPVSPEDAECSRVGPRRPLPSPPESDYGFTREPGTTGLGSLKTRSVDAGLGRGLREQLATSMSQAREVGGDRMTLPMELSGATPRRHAVPPSNNTGLRHGKKKGRAPTVPPHASLPETPVFTRGCDIPRAPYRPPAVGIPVLRSSLSEEGDRLVLCGPARGWYPKQRQNKAARSTENLDQASSLWGEPRKPQTLPPNLNPPKFFHRSPREALRRVTSLLIRRGASSNKEPRPSKEVVSPNGASGSQCDTPQRQKRSFFRSFWKKSKHYSLEQ